MQLQRLIALADDPRQLVVEGDLLDSVAPRYLAEPYYLLTLFEPVCASEEEARRAVERSVWTRRINGVVRPAREFTARNTLVEGRPTSR